MSKIYGYARISRKEQSIERQIRNIKADYPEAVIYQEAFTGTKMEGRAQLEKILKAVQSGDTVVFDSVSRMSRNADEGIALYDELFSKNINLVFIKEPHINTETYRKAINESISMTGNKVVDAILEGVNNALRILRKQQIEIAFEQAQKEVDDLHERTREGIQTARLAGKQIGQITGATLNIKKEAPAKAMIRKHYKGFGGTCNGKETAKLAGISWNTFKKYLAELETENA